MKPMPDLADVAAMADRGRRSALMSARKEALDALRDDYTHLERADVDDMDTYTDSIIEACERLATVAGEWRKL